MNERCIEWRGGKTSAGYGQIWERGKFRQYAHRWAYEKFYGPIPKGLYVLHSCDNPPCINPKHLRAGTHAENVADMVSRGRDWQHKKTHCPKGHPLTHPNLVLSDLRNGRRRCKECHYERTRRVSRRRTLRLRSEKATA